tara:strand:+ start:2551 stop:2697 length:147 start_codon:yes stop_codon:yes gene_type:complete
MFHERLGGLAAWRLGGLADASKDAFYGMVHIWTIFPFLPETTEAMGKN